MGEVAQLITSLATLIAVLGSLWISLGNRRVNLETKAIATEAKGIAEKTELNTNSMKDALVKATGIAAHAEGKEEGRIAGEIKAAELAKGKLSI